MVVGSANRERNKRGDCRKLRQYRVKGHPSGDDDDAVLADVLPDAKKNVLPTSGGNF
jgi:hypothetical protein